MSQTIQPGDALEVALGAVRDAARLASGLRSLRQDVKTDGSPVTVADFGAQALVCAALQAAYPDEPVVGEESSAALRADPDLLEVVVAAVQSVRASASADAVCSWIDRGRGLGTESRFWTVDPIDGTKGYVRGAHFAVALARIDHGVPVIAALACPKLAGGIVLLAAKGRGALCAPLDGDGPIERTRVSGTDDLAAARLAESFESRHGDRRQVDALIARARITAPAIRMDSQAKYAVLARADADVYVRIPPSVDFRDFIWDHAAGSLLVEEAGGRVTDLTGRPLRFGLGTRLADNRGILASNAVLHDALLAAVAPSSV